MCDITLSYLDLPLLGDLCCSRSMISFTMDQTWCLSHTHPCMKKSLWNKLKSQTHSHVCRTNTFGMLTKWFIPYIDVQWYSRCSFRDERNFSASLEKQMFLQDPWIIHHNLKQVISIENFLRNGALMKYDRMTIFNLRHCNLKLSRLKTLYAESTL